MSNWKEQLYNNINKLQQNKLINDPKRFLEYVESEANKLVEPIIINYPEIVNISKRENGIIFRIDNCELKIAIKGDIAEFYEVIDEGVLLFKTVKFAEKALLVKLDDTKYKLFTQEELDGAFEKVFEKIWARNI